MGLIKVKITYECTLPLHISNNPNYKSDCTKMLTTTLNQLVGSISMDTHIWDKSVESVLNILKVRGILTHYKNKKTIYITADTELSEKEFIKKLEEYKNSFCPRTSNGTPISNNKITNIEIIKRKITI